MSAASTTPNRSIPNAPAGGTDPFGGAFAPTAPAPAATWHVGALAGIEGDERDKAIAAAFAAGLEGDGPDPDAPAPTAGPSDAVLEELDAQAFDHAPLTSLSACLALRTRDFLDGLARHLDVKGTSKLKKAELAGRLAESIAEAGDVVEHDFLSFPDELYTSVRRVFEDGPVAFDLADVAGELPVHGGFPYVALFREGSRVTALIPDEVRPLVAAVDFDEMDLARDRSREAGRYAATAAAYYGIISLVDLCDAYQADVEDPLGDVQFAGAVGRNATEDAPYEVAYMDDATYIVHYTLGEEWAGGSSAFSDPEVVAAAGLEDLDPDAPDLAEQIQARLADPDVSEAVGAALDRALDRLDDERRGLLDLQSAHDRRPLAGLVSDDPLDWVFDCPEAEALTRYLDLHVPDGEDDYTYAESVVEAIVDGVQSGAAPRDILDVVAGYGATECCEDPNAFLLLFTNFYNAIPQWELHGWAPAELAARAGGRVFRDDAGRALKVGRNDPCPCGSGKKYKKCCGRSAQ